MLVYDRIEPEGRCVSPDGHEWTEFFRLGSNIPQECICLRCGKSWTIVTFDEPDEGARV